jgi:hypothetical protein
MKAEASSDRFCIASSRMEGDISLAYTYGNTIARRQTGAFEFAFPVRKRV